MAARNKALALKSEDQRHIGVNTVSHVTQDTIELYNLKNILRAPKKYIFTNMKQSLRYTTHITNAILEDKILSDLGNFRNKVPYQNLRDYVSVWFLRRYGNHLVVHQYI